MVLALVQAFGYALWLERSTEAPGGLPLVFDPGWGFRFMCVLTLTTGTMFVMWLGEQITERGIGNGMSLLIFAGIVVRLPNAIISTFDQLSTGQIGPIRILFLLRDGRPRHWRDRLRRTRASADCRAICQTCGRPPSIRRLEHAHSAQGQHRRRDPGDLRLVHPVVLLDGRAAVRAGNFVRRALDQVAYGMPLYNLLYVVGIVFFAYFYTSIIFNPDDVAENMRKYGGFIPGIRRVSGRPSTSTRFWRGSPSSARCISPSWRCCRNC